MHNDYDIDCYMMIIELFPTAYKALPNYLNIGYEALIGTTWMRHT